MHIAFLNPQGNFDPKDSHLTEHPDFGGQLVYVKELGLALARQGYRIDLVTRQIDDPQWPAFKEQIDHYEFEQERLRIIRLPCGGSGFLEKESLWPHLGEWVDNILSFYQQQLPDFFTAHYADGGYTAALIKQRTGIGFSFTGHSLGAQKLDKLGMDQSNADKLDNRYHFSQRIAAERLSMQNAFRVITSTTQERMDQYGHPLYESAVDPQDDDRFAVIPPGVNTQIFTDMPGPDDSSIARDLTAQLTTPERPHIVVSSRLDEKKNILGVVRAYCGSPQLREQAQLVLCIRGIDDPFTQLQQLPEMEVRVLEPILRVIQDSGSRGFIDFLNIPSQSALAATYRFFAIRGSVFVLSSFYEPFGLAPIEAGACGLAVVATRNGGPEEIFADGSGVLVDPTESTDIAAGIETALAKHAHYAQLVQQRVRSTYTWERTANGYGAVLRSGGAVRYDTHDSPLTLDADERISNYLKQST